MNILSLLKPKASVSYIYDSSSVRQGLEQMKAHKFTATPVINKDGKYIGVVSEGDFLRHILDNYTTVDLRLLENVKIKDIINTKKYKPVRINATIQDLLLLVMNQNFVSVIDDRDCFIGIITRKSVIEYFYNLEKARHAEAALQEKPEQANEVPIS
ncbi:MAG: CBS domain-containing protein [Ruminococcus sp.]|nr:CBS domain-containing protein [Ruminococcus sp.]